MPSKNAYRASQSSSGSTFGQNSQSELGANKYHGDSSFGGDFGSIFGSGSSGTSSSNVMSIEDRRKRRMAEGMSLGNNNSAPNSKRPRTETYSSIPLVANSLFSPEELSEASTNSSTSSSSTKRLPPPTSQFSPSAIDVAPPSYSSNKVPERSQLGTSSAYGAGSASDGITFGSTTDIKPDIRSSRLNPSVEFQTPSLLQPISDSKSESLSSGSGNAHPPRATSLFSPEFTQELKTEVKISHPVPPTAALDLHSKREHLFPNLKQEALVDAGSHNQQSSNSHAEPAGRLSSSPKSKEDGEDSHSSKKKKSKKEKHKHKHKDEKKHKKDKHKDKDREKDKEKKDKHRSKDKHSSSSSSAAPPVEVTNDVKLKIKLPRSSDTGKSTSSVQPSASASTSASSSRPRHSSSKTSNSSASSSATNPALPGLKMKISNKPRLSSVDEDKGTESPDDVCCPGVGPCTVCNRDPVQDQYRYSFSAAPAQGLTLKFAKSKESSKSSSSKESSSSSSKDSKKSKDKTSKSSSSSSSSSYANSLSALSSGSRLPGMSSSSHHMHKNGMEKSSKKKDKSAV